MAYDYARTASDLEIGMWIKFNYHQWTGKEAIKPRRRIEKPCSKHCKAGDCAWSGWIIGFGSAFRF